MKTRIVFVAVLALSMEAPGSSVFAQTMHGMGMPPTGGGGGTTYPGATGGMSNGLLNSYGGGSYGGGSYGGGSSGTTTIEGSHLTGAAALAQGLGQYTYDSARAARQLEQARHLAIENRLDAQKANYAMRRLNQANWLADHPHSTLGQIAQINRSRLPRRLSSNELDPSCGLIRWPAVLERSEFETIRQQLDDIFAHRADEQFGVGSAVYSQTQRLARDMRALLDEERTSMSQMEWIQAMRFIESLAYETRFASETTTGRYTVAN